MANRIASHEALKSKKNVQVKKPSLKNNFSLLLNKKILLDKKKNTQPKLIKKNSQEIKKPASTEKNSKIILSENNNSLPSIPFKNELINGLDKDHRTASVEKAVISFAQVEEIHALVKKLSLSFNSKKKESSFFIQEGIFSDTKFSLIAHDKNLDIVLTNASSDACTLLAQHRNTLAKKLLKNGITLGSVLFK